MACDVSNPLFGENGATYIYGPQKGADAKMIPKLDFAMSSGDSVKMCTGKSVNQIPGSGAAGGMGAALLAFCETTLTKGIDVVFNIDFHRSKDADLVITQGRHGLSDHLW